MGKLVHTWRGVNQSITNKCGGFMYNWSSGIIDSLMPAKEKPRFHKREPEHSWAGGFVFCDGCRLYGKYPVHDGILYGADRDGDTLYRKNNRSRSFQTGKLLYCGGQGTDGQQCTKAASVSYEAAGRFR